jgi:hypothetical protein
MTQPKEGGRRQKTGLDVFHDLMNGVYILLLIALIIFAFQYDGILKAIHDYQQPTCRLVK